MEIGWCDVCLRVARVRDSRAFYERLGFWRVEGSDDAGWAVVTNGQQRLGLFEPAHMGTDSFSLNFRGANIAELTEELAGKGFRFQSGPTLGANGAGSATLRDPDGHAIFLDSAPGEVRKDLPMDESEPVV